MYPKELRYSRTHEWVRVEGNQGTVGITYHAAAELGDVTYLELPELGFSVVRGDVFGVIESIKAVEDLVAPVGGQITEVNNPLVSALDTINRDPYGEGWLVAVEMDDLPELDELMTAEEYETFVEEGGE